MGEIFGSGTISFDGRKLLRGLLFSETYAIFVPKSDFSLGTDLSCSFDLAA